MELVEKVFNAIATCSFLTEIQGLPDQPCWHSVLFYSFRLIMLTFCTVLQFQAHRVDILYCSTVSGSSRWHSVLLYSFRLIVLTFCTVLQFQAHRVDILYCSTVSGSSCWHSVLFYSFRFTVLTFCPVLQFQVHHVDILYCSKISGSLCYLVNVTLDGGNVPNSFLQYLCISPTPSTLLYHFIVNLHCSCNDKDGILFYIGYCHLGEHTSMNSNIHLSYITILIAYSNILLLYLYFYVCY